MPDARRIVALWFLFFTVCFGLGYPTLNRYDPGKGGESDASEYRDMLLHGSKATIPAFNHRARLLTPFLGRLVFRVALGHVGTWDAGYFALLTVNSGFVAGIAVLIFLLAHATFQDARVALTSALLYLLDFAVPNHFLAGLVDAGEAFALVALTYTLSRRLWWSLPLIVAVGSVQKETLFPFAMAYAVGWALAENETKLKTKFTWIVLAGLSGSVTVILTLSWTNGQLIFPWTAFRDLYSPGPKLRDAVGALVNRNFWYVFVYLLPLGLLRVRSLPRPWRAAVLLATALAFFLEVYHGPASAAAASAFGRAGFEIAGPLLTCSLAVFLVEKLAEPGNSTGNT